MGLEKVFPVLILLVLAAAACLFAIWLSAMRQASAVDAYTLGRLDAVRVLRVQEMGPREIEGVRTACELWRGMLGDGDLPDVRVDARRNVEREGVRVLEQARLDDALEPARRTARMIASRRRCLDYDWTMQYVRGVIEAAEDGEMEF